MLARNRLRFMFWLDFNKPAEYEIVRQIDELKKKRSFAKTVRDGIRLVYDLSHGKTDVLEELFPWVLEQARLSSEQKIQGAGDVAQNALQEQIDRLERLILQQGELPVAQLSAQEPEELEIKQTGRDSSSAWNFMISSALLVYGNCDSLQPEVVEYGLRTGRIPRSMVAKKPESVTSVP